MILKIKCCFKYSKDNILLPILSPYLNRTRSISGNMPSKITSPAQVKPTI